MKELVQETTMRGNVPKQEVARFAGGHVAATLILVLFAGFVCNKLPSEDWEVLLPAVGGLYLVAFGVFLGRWWAMRRRFDWAMPLATLAVGLATVCAVGLVYFASPSFHLDFNFGCGEPVNLFGAWN